MILHYFPLSTFSQKALIAFAEKEAPFTREIVNLATPEGRAAYKKIYLLAKVPLLLDDGRFIPESTIIIEYLDDKFGTGTRLIPRDAEQARRVRYHDRIADLYLNNPAQTIFFDSQKPVEKRNPEAVASARGTLDTMYAYLDKHLATNKWSQGDSFTMADCAAAPPLGYLTRLHPFEAHKNLAAYWNRLAERPSVARVLSEAQAFLAQQR